MTYRFGEQYQSFFDENRARRLKEEQARNAALVKQLQEKKVTDALWDIANGCPNAATRAYNALRGY